MIKSSSYSGNQKMILLSITLGISFMLTVIFLILFGVTYSTRKNLEITLAQTTSTPQTTTIHKPGESIKIKVPTPTEVTSNFTNLKEAKITTTLDPPFHNFRGVPEDMAVYGNSWFDKMPYGDESKSCVYDPSQIQLVKGENVICYPYLGVEFFLHIYVPTTYVDNDILVVAPGRAGNGYQYIAEVLPIAEQLNTVFITPDWEIAQTVNTTFTKYMYFFGGVYANKDWSLENSVVIGDSPLTSTDKWWYNFWTRQSQIVRELLNLPDTVGWIFYGDDAGGIPVMGYAAFWYHNMPHEDRPKKLIVGVCSFYLTMVYPMLKTSYLEPVDRGVCFAGEIPELMDYSGIDIAAAKSKIRSVFDSVTNENAYNKAFEVINEAGYYIGRGHNVNLTNALYELNETGVANHIWDVFDMTKQLPFPYGLGNITEALGVNVEELIFNYTNTPLTVMQTSVDTNPQGGVTKPHYSYTNDTTGNKTSYEPYNCHDAPGLLNNKYSIPQGPYRLARNTNFFYSGRYYQKFMRGNTTWSRTHIENNKNMKLYDWDYVSCPGVGHNSIGEAHCLGAYLSVFDNATETRDAMANEDFNPTLYYNMSSDFNLDRYGTPQICLNGHFGNDTSTGSTILYDDDIEAVSDYEDQGYFPLVKPN